jgi:hypothetical protein
MKLPIWHTDASRRRHRVNETALLERRQICGLPAIATATATTTTATTATTTAITVVATTTAVVATATAATAVTTTAAAISAAAAATTATAVAATTTTAAEATTTTAAATTALLPLLRLIHAKRPAVEGTAIHALDRLGGLFGSSHGHEREPAGAAGFAVRDQVDITYGSEFLERSTDAISIGIERKISNVQTSVHRLLDLAQVTTVPPRRGPWCSKRGFRNEKYSAANSH